MKVTPFNLVFAVLLGHFGVNLLSINKTSAKSLNAGFSYWHLVILIFIVVADIILRAIIADTKKLWLIESLCVVVSAALVGFIL
ncbi:hypothetical protein [Desertivirga brevis]|uniref:hypothetical protein n=1 Tax=Desertivirga brevis TaxID=2810310 RepID=UPI001A978584|nr:hypothetical protein [Pedobacter sp. SYSU D00873]